MRKFDIARCSAVVAGIVLLPVLAVAHPAGMLDRYGCHDDKRDGTYHCHRGPYKDIPFRSKNAMLEQLEGGATPTDAKQSDPDLMEQQESLMGPVLGERTSDQRAAGSGELVTPKGIEKRLAVLDDLREKGLITPKEYEQKRKEIIGQL